MQHIDERLWWSKLFTCISTEKFEPSPLRIGYGSSLNSSQVLICSRNADARMIYLRNELSRQDFSSGRQNVQKEMKRAMIDLLIGNSRRHGMKRISNALQDGSREHWQVIEVQVSDLIETTEFINSVDLNCLVNN